MTPEVKSRIDRMLNSWSDAARVASIASRQAKAGTKVSFQADSFQVPWDAQGPARYHGVVRQNTKNGLRIEVTHGGVPAARGQKIVVPHGEETLKIHDGGNIMREVRKSLRHIRFDD